MEIQKQKEKKQKETPQKSKKEKEEDETPLGLLTKDLIGTLLEAEEKEERQRELKRADPVRANHMTDKDRQDLLYVLLFIIFNNNIKNLVDADNLFLVKRKLNSSQV